MSGTDGTMIDRVEAYVQWKQDLGYSFHGTANELRRFARFADQDGHHGPITASLILRWAQSAEGCSRLYRSRRVETARSFARFEATFEPRTQVPPRRVLGPAHRRIRPYIYTQQEITDLMRAASGLSPAGGLRPLTYRTLIGLLASTGLRVCEALRLGRTDLDPDKQLLVIRQTKFCKSRIVPLDPSVTRSLVEYALFRDEYHRTPSTDRFLVSEQGRALLPSVVHYTFQKLRAQVRLDYERSERSPRLYDLRHTFACTVMQEWYTQGADVNQRLPYLSTYLGHVRPTDTYWYLSAVPELMALADKRFSAAMSHGIREVGHDDL